MRFNIPKRRLLLAGTCSPDTVLGYDDLITKEERVMAGGTHTDISVSYTHLDVYKRQHWSCCSARNGSALYWCFCCFSPCPFTSFQSSVLIVFGVPDKIILTSLRFSRRNIRSKKLSFRWIQSYFSNKFSIKLKKNK